MKTSNSKLYPQGYKPKISIKEASYLRNQLLNAILKSTPEEVVDTNIFAVMTKRRSTRKFLKKHVPAPKVDKIIAAADTAPTVGNFQGFEIFYIRSPKKKKALVKACNNQPYVDAPVVLVFCKNPSRIKMKFPANILKKFAIQDAALAAAYAQLTAHALGLSSIWIGMFDEKQVMDVIGTDLVPTSALCIGYPQQTKHPKRRRNLKELVHVVWD